MPVKLDRQMLSELDEKKKKSADQHLVPWGAMEVYWGHKKGKSSPIFPPPPAVLSVLVIVPPLRSHFTLYISTPRSPLIHFF